MKALVEAAIVLLCVGLVAMVYIHLFVCPSQRRRDLEDLKAENDFYDSLRKQ